MTLPSRKALALLVYLVAEEGNHSRGKLATLLWPNSDEARARASLRLALNQLRRELREGDEATDEPRHLIVERDSVGFDLASDFDFDLHAIQSAARIARSATHAGADAKRVSNRLALEKAVEAYRGDFLEGFSLMDAPDFDEWASRQRERCHQLLNQIFDCLSQWQFEAGELSQAIESALRWTTHDPLNEPAHRRLIQLHLAAGDRASAWRTYQNCRAILERELNAEPAPETQALADQIRNRQLESALPERVKESKVAENLFVGRADEHTTLVTAFHAVKQGRAQVVTLEGEPGIGKTRLATEFMRWAAAHGAVVLQGRAFETGNGLPYQPVVEVLRAALRPDGVLLAHASRFLDSLSPVWLSELTRLLPELHERYPNLPAPMVLHRAEAQTRLFEAVVRFGSAITQYAPLIVFIDDVQWADAASLDLLRYAARSWASSLTPVPVLIILAMRSDDLIMRSVGNQTLDDWLTGFRRDIAVTSVPLQPLTLDGTRRLAQALTDPHARKSAKIADDISSEQLYADTGGHPLFIIETVKSLHELGRLNGIPPGIRDLIRSRLSRLSATSWALCMAAAVLGSQFSFELLCRVAAVTEGDGLPAFEELLARGLICETRDGYLFAHDRIREVAYAEAAEARRKVLHRRALESLEPSTVPSAELARHALAAGLTERAFHLSLSAGDEAMRVYAVRDAIGHYEQAQASGVPTDSLATAEVFHLYTQLGLAYQINDQREAALALYEEMLSQARKRRAKSDATSEAMLDVVRMERAALDRKAELMASGLRDFSRPFELLGEARAIAEAHNDRVGLAETEARLAQTSLYAGKLRQAMEQGERAFALAHELNDKDTMARSLTTMAYIGYQTGRWTQVQACAQQAHPLYVELGNRQMEADCLTLTAEAQLRFGQPQASLATAHAAHALGIEIENVWVQAATAEVISLALLDLGRYEEAVTMAQAGVAAARATRVSHLLISNLTALGVVYRILFMLDEACEAHEEARDLNERTPHPYFTGHVAAELCADYALRGEWDKARQQARRARLALQDEGMAVGIGFMRWLEIEALLHDSNDVSMVEQLSEELRRFGEQFKESKRYHIVHLRSLAALDLASNGLSFNGRDQEHARGQAIAHLEAAADLAAEIGLPGELWQIHVELGKLYHAQHQLERASNALARASDIAHSLANGIEDEQLRAHFLSAALPRIPLTLSLQAEY